MNLYLFDQNEIVTFTLPNKKVGNFWVTDNDGKNVVNIAAEDDNWIMSGSNNTKIIYDNNYIDSTKLLVKNFYLVEKNSNKYVIFVDNIKDKSFKYYKVNSSCEIKVGSNPQCEINLNNGYLNELHAKLNYNGTTWSLTVNESLVYINNFRVSSNDVFVSNGDVINIYGLKIVVVGNLLFINNPTGNLIVNSQNLMLVNISSNGEIVEEEIENAPLYKDEEYFFKSPRLRSIIETLKMQIVSPPAKQDEKNMPLIYTLGPMMTMGASSVVNLSTIFTRVADGEITVEKAVPTIIVSSAMICSMLVWPFLIKSYEKKQRKQREEKRQSKYKEYLEEKKKEMQNEYNKQISTLRENLLSTEDCFDIIFNKKRVLWERKIEQADFLTVRVGVGSLPFDADINYRKEEFTMDDDNLIKMLESIVDEYSTMDNVPISYSFLENNITAIYGLYQEKKILFLHNMMLQMMAYHSYDNLKFVIFTNKKNQKNWKFLKNSLYSFSDDKGIRFFATNTEEMQDVSIYLDRIFQHRKSINGNNNIFQSLNTYYFIIIDDIDAARKIDIIENILEEKENLGFSIVIIEDKLSKLPSQCTNFISLGDKTSGIIKNDVVSNAQIRFVDEVNPRFDMSYVTHLLSNIPIYFESKESEIPKNVTFLEMFGVGEVEQLNVLNRWKENDPTKSLKTWIGLNENCDPFVLDLHEKQHGPHGLIAGMTGSGKSEFIITYILSMAVNYSPEEVSFVLIDYKGGGLTGAFENQEMGIKLPHVVGTITNLDKSEINRALVSIESELTRRQQKFNEVRESTGESTIDIYKYQKMYRDGIVDEPMPHLIIVSDEFAELKEQQPDFMDDLVSAARIGRSLGVHLILATQKPSGVVNAQIWSNSKFKICLKVQDKSDSMEMIKCGDAAELKDVGRFYLQVGYNELFALGQSAWAGAPYYPSKEFKKIVDKNIYFIDNVGSIYKAINNSSNKKNVVSSGEELANVLKYIINISSAMNLKIRQLWRDKIPAIIYLNNLIKKYNYVKEKYIVNPIIGEYDNPSAQSQGLLTLPITKEGNTILYGLADSGRDEFLQGLVFSLITTYTSEELNLYIVDYGAETLMNFAEAPQVGDVILSSDEDKLTNLIKMLNTLLNQRKKRFMKFNGNYLDYIKLSGDKIPNVVVIINLIENLTENNLDTYEKLFPIIRDGSKYGISFVFATNNPSGIRYKIVQTCKQLLSLQLNNDTDYREIFGRTDGIIPSKILGRGLVKREKLCEFQTITIANEENKLSVISDVITKLTASGMKKATPIPVMPEVVRLNSFIDKYKGLDSVPIGIYKDDLGKCVYDFSKRVINLVSANEIENTKGFVLNLIKSLEINNSFNKIIIDASNYFENYNHKIKYYNSNFNELITYLKQYSEEIKQTVSEKGVMELKNISHTVCILFGLEKFINGLDDEKKKEFKEILNQQNELAKINFIFIDIPQSFKKFEYEDWYKANVDSDDGIWIGFGVTQQYVIKLVVSVSKLLNIENDHAVVVKNGMPKLVKLVNEFKES